MSYIRQAIQAMQGYAYGEQPDGDALKLNTNENPYPPSPAVAEALKTFTTDHLRRYPEASCAAFRALAADLHGLKPDQIMATNGGDELLRLAVTTFVPQGGSIGSTVPTYSLYPVLAAIQEARFVTVPLTNSYDLPADFTDQMNAENVRLTCLVNPHTPSGRLLGVSTLKAIADALTGVLLVDEAYVDFVSPERHYNSLTLLECPNVIILRTLSKGYALAGLRFGYALGNADLISPMMNKTKDSYNLNSITQYLACAAFRDQTYAKKICEKVRQQRDRLMQALKGRGWHLNPSEANFVLASPPDSNARHYFEKLREKRIFVRYFDDPFLSKALRITVGSGKGNSALLDALDQIAGNN